MRLRQLAMLAAMSIVPALLCADVTVRYTNDLKFASFLPAGSLPTASLVPHVSTMRLKGSKAFADMGAFTSIIDVASGEITLIDPEHKKFAKAAFKDYAEGIEAEISKQTNLPDAQKAANSMKTNVTMKKTGRTDVIQGVQAEETEMTVLMNMAVPADLRTSDPTMKIVVQFWGARAEEALRVPAVRQLAGYSAYHSAVMNPFELIQKTLARMPGLGTDFLAKFQELMSSSPMMLKSHVEVFMPMMAVLAQRMEKQGEPLPKGFDANAPLMELSTELVEMSVDAIEDAAFEVPADFEPSSFEEIVKAVSAPAFGAPAKKP